MERLRAGDIARFRSAVAGTVSFLRYRTAELHDRDQVSLLMVRVDRLTK